MAAECSARRRLPLSPHNAPPDCSGCYGRKIHRVTRAATVLYSAFIKVSTPPPLASKRREDGARQRSLSAGSSPAPCTVRTVRSSRHRSDRRRAGIGAKNEGRLSLPHLPSVAFSGRAKCPRSVTRNQVPSLPVNYNPEATEPSPDRPLSDLRRKHLWLYVPTPSNLTSEIFEASPSAPVTPELILDSISRNPDIALFVMSSGKPMPRQLSWRGWQTRPWLKHLFGTISNPSMASHGAEKFISSLPDIHASLSVQPDSALVKTILDTCGPTSPGSSPRLNPSGCSLRTSRAISIWDLPTSKAAFRGWVIAQKRACSARLKQAQAIGVTGSSFWPTPTVCDHGNAADIRIEKGSMRFTTMPDLSPRNAGQFGLGRAARTWTILWLTMRALGWKPGREIRSSHPIQISFKTGLKSFHGTLTSNPRFQDWMMGWPENWTSATAPVTEFAAWLRLSRGQLSRLISLQNLSNSDEGVKRATLNQCGSLT
jgi:hypothetical protein